MYGLEDVRVHGVTAPAAYVDALQAAAGYTGPAEYPARVTRLDAPFLDFLNTRARLPGGGVILAAATPAAVFPDRLVGSGDAAALRERLAAGTDFLRQGFVLGADETFSGSAEVLSLEHPVPGEIRARVRSESPRVLVLPETDDGGWSVRTADGSLPVATVRVNEAFLGIRVPAGESTVRCRYAPPGLCAGAWISAASAAIVAALAAKRR
jgi:hypothetical protein